MTTRRAIATPSPSPALTGLPNGMTARPMAAADIDALLDIAHRIGLTHGRPPVAARADLVAALGSPAFDVARDSIVVTDAEQRVVLSVQAYCERPGRTWVDPLVDPDLNDAVVASLLDVAFLWSIDRALEDAIERNLSGTVLEAGALRGEDRLFAAAQRAGLSYARTYWRMERLVGPDEQPDARPSPSGLTIEHVDVMDSHQLRRLHFVHDAAFAGHHGFVPQTLDAFAIDVRHLSGPDPNGVRLAVLDGRDVGVLIMSDSRADEGLGWVEALAVLEEARGHGIARALLAHAFEYYRRAGRRGTGLSVDSINPTGALRLYEGMGMRAVEEIDEYELMLTLDEEPANESRQTPDDE